jgi:hypothetical protein
MLRYLMSLTEILTVRHDIRWHEVGKNALMLSACTVKFLLVVSRPSFASNDGFYYKNELQLMLVASRLAVSEIIGSQLLFYD